MSIVKSLRSRRGALAIVILGLAAAAGLALAVTGTLTSARAHRELLTVCPPGMSAAEGPTQDGHDSGKRACAPRGEPETFADLNTADTQVQSRESAPFSTVAPGAYMHAVSQRHAMAASADASDNAPWQLAGKPPLCAD